MQVLDSTTQMSEDDWYCVVAVFASSASWQFKGWLWSEPVEIFSRVVVRNEREMCSDTCPLLYIYIYIYIVSWRVS